MSIRIILAAAVVVLLGMAAMARTAVIRSVDLSEVLNKTMCPIKVEIDENPDRVPRRIKMMKCEQQPEHWCRARHIPAHECCHHKHERHLMECVEMKDTVLVYYKKEQKTDTMEVSVGCSCVIQQASRAEPLTGPS